MIVTSLLREDLERAGLSSGDADGVQAFGLWLRDHKRSDLSDAYAVGVITAREYLIGLALERIP